VSSDQLPLVREVPFQGMPAWLPRWASLPYCVCFDTAVSYEETGRFSFLAADPYHVWTVPEAASGVEVRRTLAAVAELKTRPDAATASECPCPFQGGLACLWSYDLGRFFEELPISAPRFRDHAFPLFWGGLYDVVLAVDHVERRAWLVSQGLPAENSHHRHRRATARLERFLALLNAPGKKDEPWPTAANNWDGQRSPAGFPAGPIQPLSDGLWSNFSREEYLAAVRGVVRRIRSGDVFQVNLSQRLYLPATRHPVSAYLALRESNPAPMSGYLDLGPRQVLSSSPERFLRVREAHVETRPIKGTRPRHTDPRRDAAAAAELAAGEKERAENTMIVDLLRNDLSRVARPESVHVTVWNRVESYASVHHLVSVVEADLPPDKTWYDLMQAAFPGGSITGAPKIHAMEIIAECEPHARGPYCGSLGYVSLSGQADFNILIRTVLADGGWWIVPVGGGITAQSDPADEYAETWDKARAIIAALTSQSVARLPGQANPHSTSLP